MGTVLRGFDHLFRELGVRDDEQTQMVLSEIGDVFATDRFSADKTPEEWLRWLVDDIRASWKFAQQQETPKEEFINDYVAEMAEKFSRVKNPLPITASSIEMAVRGIVK